MCQAKNIPGSHRLSRLQPLDESCAKLQTIYSQRQGASPLLQSIQPALYPLNWHQYQRLHPSLGKSQKITLSQGIKTHICRAFLLLSKLVVLGSLGHLALQILLLL